MLTPRQLAWCELVTDFRGVLWECARMAGYKAPDDTVRAMLENPYVVRAVLRRYHRRMMKTLAMLRPQIKAVREIPLPRKRGVYVPLAWAEKKIQEKQGADAKSIVRPDK